LNEIKNNHLKIIEFLPAICFESIGHTYKWKNMYTLKIQHRYILESRVCVAFVILLELNYCTVAEVDTQIN